MAGSALGVGLLTLTAPRSLADRATYDPTKTMIAFPISTPPVIDGVINDEEWLPDQLLVNQLPTSVNPLIADGLQGGTMTTGTPADQDRRFSCQIRARYDTNNLYVAVGSRRSIQTDSADRRFEERQHLELDDSVEVFVDGDNANDATWAAGQLGGQVVITANNAYQEDDAGQSRLRTTRRLVCADYVNGNCTGYTRSSESRWPFWQPESGRHHRLQRRCQ